MADRTAAAEGPGRSLADVLSRARQASQLRACDVARAMGLPLRTYQHFEAGESRATPARLQAFAAAVGCDYRGLLLAAGGLDPELVLAGAANKAISIALDALGDLLAKIGPDDFASLTGAEIFSAFDEAQRALRMGAAARSRARLAAGEEPLLTPRQVECLRWAQAGKSSTDIGAILGISHRTVDSYLAEACARLGVRTRVQAISLAIDLGFLSPRPP